MIKLYEAFAGIGSQFRAASNVFGKKNVEVVGQIEWYIDAIIGYIAINSNDKLVEANKNLDIYKNVSKDSKNIINNIKTLTDPEYIYTYNSYVKFHNQFNILDKNISLPENIDILTYSFPCQDLSIQGKQLGMNKTKKTRSSLLWRIGELLSNCKSMPKYLLMENVSAILNKNHSRGFNRWMNQLSKLGYNNQYYVLNANCFGLPQNRKRIFLLSILQTHQQKTKFVFPEFNNDISKICINDILESDIPTSCFLPSLDKYKLTNFSITSNNINKAELINYSNFQSERIIYDPKYCGPTLTASGANSRIKIIQNKKIRSLSACECLKYMGYTKNDYLNMIKTKALKDQDIIFLAGNSIPVPILESIFKSLKF